MTAPFGIRSERDIGPYDGEYVVDSVKLANEQAPDGYSFYFDEPDMPEQTIDNKHCIKMFGWLVPKSEAQAFESIWKRRDDDHLDKYDYGVVSFSAVNGKPVAAYDFDEEE